MAAARPIKFIAMMGVLAFVFLWLMAAGLRHAIQGVDAAVTQVGEPRSPFNGKRAFKDLKTVLEFGPRPADSAALESLRGYIEGEFKKVGVPMYRHAFQSETPVGPRNMVNLYGVVQGDKEGIILLGNHYETKEFNDGTVFVGANDAGSTTAWMIEMARAMGPTRQGYTVWLCFFDGEEAFKKWSESDSLYGSRAFVTKLRETGDLSNVKAMINVDMIGDKYLGIRRDNGAPPWLLNIVWEAAQETGHDAYFLPFGETIMDDHLPFRQAGIPSIDVIDFCYGKSRFEHGRLWHTSEDTLDKLCWESLQVVGDVIYHGLSKVDVFLANGQKSGIP